jgi:hypothetical protein
MDLDAIWNTMQPGVRFSARLDSEVRALHGCRPYPRILLIVSFAASLIRN